MNKKRNRKGSRRRRRIVRLWTYDEARKALPFVRSVMRSVREHRLEAQGQHRKALELSRRPGRPDRNILIAREDAINHARQADQQFEAAVQELESIDIFCMDPVRGEAIIPFVRDNQLAWFQFDLFEKEPLQTWRFHEDPLETRRPITEVLEGPTDQSLAV